MTPTKVANELREIQGRIRNLVDQARRLIQSGRYDDALRHAESYWIPVMISLVTDRHDPKAFMKSMEDTILEIEKAEDKAQGNR
ncbi:MAG: hypothetical protein ACREWE_03400 [Gammaproteobacteria bacterium]